MLSILLVMGVILVLAAAVVLYVAFPHRGEEMPHAPWVGEAMRQGVNALPTIHNQSGGPEERHGQHQRH